MSAERTGKIERSTGETNIRVELSLDRRADPMIRTGLGFLDHMLTALAFHAGWSLTLACEGDLDVDDHHTVEDCALALGQAVDRTLGDRAGCARFGWALAPMDETLGRAAVDLSGRPASVVNLGLRRERLGDVSCENLTHFFESLAVTARCALHVDVLRGENDHHRAEAAFKATALALRQAVARSSATDIPSTKGTL